MDCDSSAPPDSQPNIAFYEKYSPKITEVSYIDSMSENHPVIIQVYHRPIDSRGCNVGLNLINTGL